MYHPMVEIFQNLCHLINFWKILGQEPTLLNIVSPTQYHICTNSDQQILKTVSISVPSNVKCMHVSDLNWMAFIEIQHKSYFQSNIVNKKIKPITYWSWLICSALGTVPRVLNTTQGCTVFPIWTDQGHKITHHSKNLQQKGQNCYFYFKLQSNFETALTSISGIC